MRFARRLTGAALVALVLTAAASSPQLDEAGVIRTVREGVALRYQVPLSRVEVTWEGPALTRILGPSLPALRSGRLVLEGVGSLVGRCSPRLVWESGTLRRPFFPQLRVAIRQEVLVMGVPLRRGATFVPAMCHRTMLAVERDLGSPMLDPEPYDGAVARREIASGSVLLPEMFDLPTLVRPGSQVSVRLVSGQLLVTTQGRVVSEGRLGQLVRVVNPDSRREFMARVVGPDQVEVRMDQEEMP